MILFCSIIYYQPYALKIIFYCCLFICTGCISSAQPEYDGLLNEVTTNFQNKAVTVSSVLTDQKYLPIHPQTAFRDLIKANCTADILKITTDNEPGKKIRVLATLSDKEGTPVAGALVYLYQTDSRGWYAAGAPHVMANEGDMRHARLFGYVMSDEKGKFELLTVKPGGYPRSDLPAHIHVHIMKGGYNIYVTEFLFDDDDRLTGKTRDQAVSNQFLISKPEKTNSPFEQQFSYHLVLNKE